MRKRIRVLQKKNNYNTTLDYLSKESLVLLKKEEYLFGKKIDQEIQLLIDKKKKELNNKVYSRYAKMFLNIKPFKEVDSVFTLLQKNKIPIVIFSDFPIENKLKTLGLNDRIDYAFSSFDAGYLKPDVRCFNYLYKNSPLSNFKKDEVLYVGDSLEKDWNGAKNFGFTPVLINTKEHGERKFSNWKVFFSWLEKNLEG